MLDKNEIAQTLLDKLGVRPLMAERLRISGEWEVDFVTFKNRPFEGVSTIFTNGVSTYDGCHKNIEFLFTYNDSNSDLVAFLATYLKNYFINNCNKISVGDSFSLNERIINGYQYTGIYTTKPCYYPEDFFEVLSEVNFLWIIPIYQSEYDYILKKGADAFESYLEKHDPDMSNLDRDPLF